jgi:hypothetical protein
MRESSMAVPIPEPLAVPSDLVTVQEGVLLLKDTPYPVSESTVRRWIPRHQMFVRQFRRRHYISFTQLLIAHRDEYAASERAAARKRERPKP